MKKIYILTIILLIVAQANTQEKKRFEYALKPGDAKWQSLETTYERNAALQIPLVLINSIPTEELLEVCLEYPYLIEATFYQNGGEALNYLISKFNGFKELINREDIVDVLIKKEKALSTEFESISKAEPKQRGHFSIQSLVVDLLFTHNDVINKIKDEQLIELKRTLERNQLIKEKHPMTFGALNEAQFNDLYNLISEKEGIIGDRSLSYSSITIYTPKGSIVPNTRVLTGSDIPASTPDQYANLVNQLNTVYNGATVEEGYTAKYNTAGWTWHTSESGEKVHISYSGFGYDSIYVHDKSYIIAPESYATKVVYGNYYHSATIDNAQWYVSKWGPQGPRVRHHPTALPNGTDSSFDNVNYYPGAQKHYYMPNPNCTLNGNSQVCGQETYTISNLPSGATVLWSLNPQWAGILSGQNENSRTFNASINDYGPCRITANVYLANTQILSLSRDISIGAPIPCTSLNFQSGNGGNGHWSANSSTNKLTYVDFNNIAYPNRTIDYRIYKINNDLSIGDLVEQRFSISADYSTFGPYNAGWYLVGIRAHNSCGYSEWIESELECINTFRSTADSLDNIIDIYLDASTNILRIRINDPNKSINDTDDYTFQIWNDTKLIASYKTKQLNYSIDTSDLKSGIYVIRVIIRDKVYSKKIIIKK